MLRPVNSYPAKLIDLIFLLSSIVAFTIVMVGYEASSSLPEQANRMNENSNKPNFLIMSYFLKSALLYFFNLTNSHKWNKHQ